MKKAVTIVKVQRPLQSFGGIAMHLVYAKGRKKMTHQGIPAAAKRALGDDPKGYFKATREPMYGAWVAVKHISNRYWVSGE